MNAELQVLVGIGGLEFEGAENASFLVIAIIAATSKDCNLEVFVLHASRFCLLQMPRAYDQLFKPL